MRRLLSSSTMAVAFAVVLLSGVAAASPEEVDPPAALGGESPELARIARASGPIEIDGKLDEPAWSEALRLTLDYEWFPAENVPAPVETEVFLAYDDDNLYVGYRAHDPEPGAVRAHLMDRDAIETFVQDDHVVLMVDTFNDERRAFQFRVNPLGVQADAIFSQLEGIEDFSWDILWESAGHLTEQGYEVEIALPMDQLRFAAGDGVQTWGFDLGRSYPRSIRHRIANTPRDRSNSCVLCQAQKITGFEGIEPGRNLVVTPTVTLDRTDARSSVPDGNLEAGEEDVDPGISVRWGITPNYTLNATLNPDFSQVEADVAQLDVNERFALFFPEKRPFFLDGIDFFSTLIDAVFTRTVVDPDWGAKLTGKQGKNGIGVFATRDTFNSFLIPSNQGSDFASLDQEVEGSVVRYRRDIGSGSSLGVIYAGREADAYHNRVGGIDGFLRFSDADTLSFQYLRSDTLYPEEIASEFGQPSEAFDAGALEVLYSHEKRSWDVYARWRDFDPGFRADSGFEPRVDIRRSALVVRRKFWPDEDAEPWWNRQSIGFYGVRTEDHSGQLTDELYTLAYDVSGPLQSYVSLEAGTETQYFGGVLYDDLVGADLYFEVQPSGKVRFDFYGAIEETVDFANNQPADQLFLQPRAEVKAGRHLNLQLAHTLQQLDVAGGRLLEANLTEVRTVYQFNVRTFARAILQWRDIERDPSLYEVAVEPDFEQLFTQLLFSYRLNAETVLYVGYSDNRLSTVDFDLTQTDRTFFVKLGYAWVV